MKTREKDFDLEDQVQKPTFAGNDEGWPGSSRKPSLLNPLGLPTPLTGKQLFYLYGPQGIGAAVVCECSRSVAAIEYIDRDRWGSRYGQVRLLSCLGAANSLDAYAFIAVSGLLVPCIAPLPKPFASGVSSCLL